MVTDAPIIGNGELGAAIGGASLAGGDGTTASSVSAQQSFYLGQMDFGNLPYRGFLPEPPATHGSAYIQWLQSSGNDTPANDTLGNG